MIRMCIYITVPIFPAIEHDWLPTMPWPLYGSAICAAFFLVARFTVSWPSVALRGPRPFGVVQPDIFLPRPRRIIDQQNAPRHLARAARSIQALIPEAVKDALLEILRREKYFFEDSRPFRRD